MDTANGCKKRRKESIDDDDEENKIKLTYHRYHGGLVCACGTIIQGNHCCNIKPATKIEIQECKHPSSKNCPICLEKEKEHEYGEQWRKDESGYSCCVFCGEKSYEELPKLCNCAAYVDTDGVQKCKACHEPWTEQYMETECSFCGSYWCGDGF